MVVAMCLHVSPEGTREHCYRPSPSIIGQFGRGQILSKGKRHFIGTGDFPPDILSRPSFRFCPL